MPLTTWGSSVPMSSVSGGLSWVFEFEFEFEFDLQGDLEEESGKAGTPVPKCTWFRLIGLRPPEATMAS
jgi:hypothetical protein